MPPTPRPWPSVCGGSARQGVEDGWPIDTAGKTLMIKTSYCRSRPPDRHLCEEFIKNAHSFMQSMPP